MPDVDVVDAPSEDTPPPSFTEAAAQAETDLAPVEEAPSPEPAPDDTPTVEPTDDEHALLSAAEEAELRTAAKDDPAKLVDGFKSAYFKKTQTLAEQRKAVQQLTDFQAALTDNPETALSALAQQFGFTVAKPATEPTAAPEETAFNAEQVVAAELGDDLAFLAPQLTKAVTKLAEHIADQKIQPIQNETTAQSARQAEAQVTQLLTTFGEKRPDWETHRPAMEELSQKLQPNGMDELDYLDLLYRSVGGATVTTPSTTASVVEKIVRAAAASDDAPRSALTDSRVTQKPAALPTFTEAAAAAERGEDWEN